MPLIEVTAAGHGRHWSGRHLVDTDIGARLRATGPAARPDDLGSGTSGRSGENPADGFLGHNRAPLDWLDGVLDRTSDRQDLLLYASIAASAPTAVTPGQGAVRAYPQPEDSDDEVIFTMANALLGRIQLSGAASRKPGRRSAPWSTRPWPSTSPSVATCRRPYPAGRSASRHGTTRGSPSPSTPPPPPASRPGRRTPPSSR